MATMAWMNDAFNRLCINEGVRTVMYRDSMGIPTTAIGFNLTRPDAAHILASVGANLHDVLNGKALTMDQVKGIFDLTFDPVIDQARSSLEFSHFDKLSDARQFVICDLVFNMGLEGWMAFTGTRALIDQATHLNAVGDHNGAHAAYAEAGAHLEASAWFSQVGDRARRDIAMLKSSVYCNPSGDGSN